MKLVLTRKEKPGQFARAGRLYKKDLEAAAFYATDRAGRLGHSNVQQKMRAVGLGRLANAVGFTSALKKRQYERNPYAVIFARGGDESLAGGALDAYSRGVTIRAKPGNKWIAFASKAMPLRVNRRRLTPALYKSSGLEARYGKLVFRPVRPDLALLVIRPGSLTGKGRIRQKGKRPGRGTVQQKEIVAFILIRETKRAKRFDQREIFRQASARVPDFMAEEMARRTRR